VLHSEVILGSIVDIRRLLDRGEQHTKTKLSFVITKNTERGKEKELESKISEFTRWTPHTLLMLRVEDVPNDPRKQIERIVDTLASKFNVDVSIDIDRIVRDSASQQIDLSGATMSVVVSEKYEAFLNMYGYK